MELRIVEAFGVALVEALACGKPVEAGNPEEVADAIIRLLEDEELRRALTTRAQARVRERCDFEVWMRKTGTYYSQLVER